MRVQEGSGRRQEEVKATQNITTPTLRFKFCSKFVRAPQSLGGKLLNQEPTQTIDPTPKTIKPKSQTQIPDQTRNPNTETYKLDPRPRSLHCTLQAKPKTLNPKHHTEAHNPQSQTLKPGPQTPNRQAEAEPETTNTRLSALHQKTINSKP